MPNANAPTAAANATVPVQSWVPLRVTVAVPLATGYEYLNQPTMTPRNPIRPPTATPTPAYEYLASLHGPSWGSGV